MINGKCIKEKHACNDCGSFGEVKNGYYWSKKPPEYTCYYFEGKFYCVKCSKIRKII